MFRVESCLTETYLFSLEQKLADGLRQFMPTFHAHEARFGPHEKSPNNVRNFLSDWLAAPFVNES